MREDAPMEFFSDWASRLPGNIARIAGILYVMDNAHSRSFFNDPQIPEKVMVRALAIGDYFAQHAALAFQKMGSDALLDKMKRAARWILARWDEENERFKEYSTTDALYDLRGGMTGDELRKVMDRFEAYGWIRIEDIATGKRPRTVHYINPALHTDPAINCINYSETGLGENCIHEEEEEEENISLGKKCNLCNLSATDTDFVPPTEEAVGVVEEEF